MKFNSITYFIEQALKNIFKKQLMSISSILTVVSCIFIVVLSYCVAVNINYMLDLPEAKNITVFLDDSIAPEERSALFGQVRKIDCVSDVRYVSPDESLLHLKKTIGADMEDIFDILNEDNPLRHSFEITVESSKYQKQVSDELKAMTVHGISKVNDMVDIANILVSLNNAVKIAGIVIVLILALFAVTIVMNTIRLTVNSRRAEIGIMKYVGATDWFIKWPFVIEGFIIGIVGGIIPSLVCWFFYGGIISSINNADNFLGRILEFRDASTIFPFITPVAVVLGGAIGVIGSITSIRKHLDV